MRSIHAIATAIPQALAHNGPLHARSDSNVISQQQLSINGLPYSTRTHWMRKANSALFDVLVCIGANSNRQTGDPTMHDAIAVIRNCSAVLTDPEGPYNLSPAETLPAFSQLSLYTNAEICPMCASAIRWAGFKEYIYGTSMDTLIEKGWGQIRISSMLVGEVLTNETDPYFLWQYDPDYACPEGCARKQESCAPVEA
ncbi:hypothetical protein BU23DRAFT_593756 [Bimuria novae-zelandiae CBS 107.79]|uniref:CMP/dCMP-type deaminase domain-containing protein n=1 Tax=Bimuria novae-zelandiae CBS 107.79 TaxID=1447943 RepID=A0A6A5UJW4_9PLEO|nr:hypothetical protein BU23DRAFT_593756 [Bimuria novae-zelandiae CBS 107.79]